MEIHCLGHRPEASGYPTAYSGCGRIKGKSKDWNFFGVMIVKAMIARPVEKDDFGCLVVEV